MKLAVIPARGGSKRIPRKNIKLFHGKPIIAWSIQAAIDSKCFDKVVVSTDDEEVASVSKEYSAEVPFMRPKDLSGDFVATAPVIHHAIDWYLDQGKEIDEVCCIYATAPFINADDIKKGLDIIEKYKCEFVFPITSYTFPIQRAIRINENQRTEMFYPELFQTRSQDLEESFHDAGQFYWGSVGAWRKERDIFSSDSIPIIIPRSRVQDIDTEEDWERAVLLFNLLQKECNK